MAVRDWDPTPYPDARRNRGAGLGDLGLEVAPPTPRLLTGSLFIDTVNRQVWAVSPALLGPALIRSLTILQLDATAFGDPAVFMVRVSPDGAGAGNYGYTAVGAPGTDIFEGFRAGGFGTPSMTHPNALGLAFTSSTGGPLTVPLHYLVNLPRWHLKVGYAQNTASSVYIKWCALVYEQVDPNTLIDLMSGL